MKLALELDGIVCDLESSIKNMGAIYYGPKGGTKEELAALPDLVPGFWTKTRVVEGVLGQLIRIKAAEPRLEVFILSTRGAHTFQETKVWLKKWLPDHLAWTLYMVPDGNFAALPAAQVFVVHDMTSHPELATKPKVIESLAELGYGAQEQLL